MPEKRKEAPAISTRIASIAANNGDNARSAPASLNEAARSVGVILATEAPVPVYDLNYGRVDEVLLMSGVEIPTSGQVPMLDSHNRWSVEDQIGSLRALAVQGDVLLAEAHFSSTAEDAFTLVREGHLTDISVGYRVLERVFVPENTSQVIDGKTYTGPIKVVTRWEVKEGSFTPIGADKNAKARAAAGITMEDSPMPEKNKDAQARADNGQQPGAAAAQNQPPVRSEAAAPAPQAPPADADAALAQERARCADITLLGRKHNSPEEAEAAIKAGTSVDEFARALLDKLAARSEAHAPSVMPGFEVGQGDAEKFRKYVADGLLLRAGSRFAPKEYDEESRRFMGLNMMETARDCLRHAGIAIPIDPVDMIGRAFTHSSSDFPHILADVAHKSIMAGAQEAAETYEAWTGEESVNDFLEHTGVSLGSFSNLDQIPEGAEYKSGTVKDHGIRYAVSVYGKTFGITLQAMVNDHLGAFTKIPNAMGRAAMRTRGNAVYSFLIDNPQLADGSALFSATHKNLAATGGPIDVTTYGAAVVAMGTQQGDNGEVLNISPSYMLVPQARKAEALVLLGSDMIGTQAQPNQINPWKGNVTPIAEGRLDAVATKPWFLAGPKGWTINLAYLYGNSNIRVLNREGWRIDGTEFKVTDIFGAYVQDYMALYKNPGNAS